MKVLGIDIGGSALKGAPVDVATGRLLAERFRIETPELATPKRMAAIVAEIARQFKWRGPIGVGYPGVIQGTVARTAANVHKGLIDCDLGKLFGQATGCRVSAVNDADAAGIAEMKFGAGKGHPGSVLLLTLGTGVGSALFYRGVLYPNTELGHVPMKSSPEAEKYMAASVRKTEDLSWHAWSKRVNEYLALVEAALWPELIVIGGGVSAKSEKFFKYLKTRARVVPAQFHNEAGIVGAALWAMESKRR
jgi:polyphosphate glucokinase